MSRADGLVVDHLTVRFGGLVAVDDVSLVAPAGRVTGLIGPNGAGKSTTFNACSGLVTPTSGTVHFDGVDVTAMAPDRRARLGIGRTFQHMELFESLSVARNVEMGAEAPQAGRGLRHQLIATKVERRAAEGAAAAAMERCGVAELAGRIVSGLSTGQRRSVELARVIAGGFRFLLLDEVSSGLDRDETRAMGAILADIATDGIGILLVEHDMSLVMSICEHLWVLDFGRLVFDGTPEEVRASDEVQRAYLGVGGEAA